METKPMRKSTDKVLKSYRSLIDFRSPRARPAWLNNNGEVRRGNKRSRITTATTKAWTDRSNERRNKMYVSNQQGNYSYNFNYTIQLNSGQQKTHSKQSCEKRI